jgi:hypothetical protein
MKQALIGVGVVIVALVVLLGVVSAFSPSSEVVVLTWTDADGAERETPLWIVEDGGSLWLRSGSPESAWLAALRERPELSLEREEQTRRYRAVPVDEDATRERINDLMAEKYGASNTLVSLFGDHSVSVAIRLEPDTAVGASPPE